MWGEGRGQGDRIFPQGRCYPDAAAPTYTPFLLPPLGPEKKDKRKREETAAGKKRERHMQLTLTKGERETEKERERKKTDSTMTWI